MKYYQLAFIFVCLKLPVWGQMNKFSFTIEYSPHYSKITDEYVDEDYKLSHNIFAKSTYSLTENFGLSLGLGFFNTGEREVSEFRDNLGIDKIKFVHNYNYISIPIGIKYSLGSWFLNPEVAVGVNISNIKKQVVWYSDGHKEVDKEEEIFYTAEFNEIIIPLLLTTGYEIELNDHILILGLKGYYSLSQVLKDAPRNAHYYGFGIIAGFGF